jgi:hypothetical protein
VNQVSGVGIVHADPQAIHGTVSDLGPHLLLRGLPVRSPANDHVDCVLGDAHPVQFGQQRVQDLADRCGPGLVFANDHGLGVGQGRYHLG